MSFMNFCTDQFIDKLLSFPAKMKDTSVIQGSSLCLMSSNPNFYPQHTEEQILNYLSQVGIHSQHIDYNSVQGLKVESLIQNLGYNFLGSKSFVSPHVSNLVQNTINFLNTRSDMLLSNSLNISNMLSDFYLDSVLMKDTEDSKISVHKKLDIASVQEPKITMSVTVKSIPPKEKSNTLNNKCSVPNGVTLNLELASRKTKELQKRSKKRRRRQKKSHCNVAKSSNSNLVDDVGSCKNTSQISSRVSSSPNESSLNIQLKHQIHMEPNLISSFLISVENVSDDSDWDCCSESDIPTETDDFELTGLVMTNLNSSIPYSFSVKMNLTAFCQDEDEEMRKFQAALLEVNKKWNESTKEVKAEQRASSKVSFAPDDQLVEVFPVEICERKGEWETYAHERRRFKRRIDELAKVILPCLADEHRLNVYKKIIEPAL